MNIVIDGCAGEAVERSIRTHVGHEMTVEKVGNHVAIVCNECVTYVVEAEEGVVEF